MPEGLAKEFDFDAVFDVDDYMFFYSEILTPENTDIQVAFLVKALGLGHPAEILDLACGFGRHTNRLAALGHHMTGIDLYPGFLELACQDAATRGVTVDFRQGDMRLLDAASAYDVVLLLFTAFGYYSDEENRLILQAVARALRPGGQLVLDINNRDGFLHLGLRPSIVTDKGGDLMIDRNSFDIPTGRLYNRRIVIRNGVRKEKPFFVRMYSYTEVRDLLRQAGLEIVWAVGGWDGQPLSLESRKMIIFAQK